MKALMTLTFFFIALNAFSFEAQVTEVKFGLEDDQGQKSLCLTVLNIEGEEFGILEDIHDCFYARKLKPSEGNHVEVDLPLSEMPKASIEITSHLPQRMYLFSDFD